MPIPRRVQGASVEQTRFGERFRVRGPAGTGGMATVYRALDQVTGQDVALKILNEQAAASADRFNQEAALLAQLSHPAIVRYVDHGTFPGGERYLAMEWLEGETLDERLSRGPIGIIDTMRMGRRLLEGLAVAHRKGIVHRDLKPTNILLPAREVTQAKLLDFGIARRTFDGRRLTSAGGAVGTPAYMSPEQVRGAATIDARSDLFSMGSLLYECLVGDTPFSGETPVAVMAKICVDEAISVEARHPDLPGAVAALLTRLLAKRPDDRPASAAEVALEMGGVVDRLIAAGLTTGEVARRRSSRGTVPALATLEQRPACAILVSRPLASELLERADRMTTWDVPGAVLQKLVADVFDETTYAEVLTAIAPFGGRAERFLGNSLAVTLIGDGAPTDLALQAGRCALALKAIVPRACFALVSGRATQGAEAIGELVANAAALLAREGPGAVRLDRASAALLEARFEIRREGTGAELRHHLLFEKGVKEAPRTVLGKEIPCVGRDREIGTLLGLWDEASGEPVARAVLVTSSAGGGKSRLRHELIDRIHARGEPFELLIGRGEVVRAGAPFAVLGPALRAAVGILGGEPAEVQQKRVLTHVQRHLRPEIAPRVAAFLGEIIGVRFPDDFHPTLPPARRDPRLMADQTLGAWLDYIEAECNARPVLLVLEDLHWGDVPSVQLVDAALRTLSDRPLMVLALARAEIDDKFPSLWVDRDLQRMSLAPLTPKSAQKMIRQILPELGDERAAWIVDRADGNPFYLEELVRAVGAGAEWDDEHPLPDSVLGMVQARFDAIGPEAKRVLRAAAVFGQSFRPSGVRALVGDQDRSLDQWLDILAGKEVLFARRAADTREFSFRHAVLQEAAYAMLAPADRVLGHRLAAEFLETAGERQAILLVDHFEKGEQRDKAAYWCRFAAEQALDANDLAAVVERADRGVRLGAHGDGLGAIRRAEAQACNWLGQYARAEEAARDALKHGVGTARFDAVGELVFALGQLGKFDEVDLWAQQIHATPPDPATESARLRCLMKAAGQLVPGGYVALAERILVEAERAPVSDPLLRAAVYKLSSMLAVLAGNAVLGVRRAQMGVEAMREAGDDRSAVELMVNWAVQLGDLGALEEAYARLTEGRALAERMNLSYVLVVADGNLAFLALYLGKAAEAREAGHRAAAVARQQGDPRSLGFVEVSLSEVALLGGDPRTAQAHAEEAVRAFERVRPLQPVGHAMAARALLAQGRLDEALGRARLASSLMENGGPAEYGEILVRVTLGECLVASGLIAEAQAVIDAAHRGLQTRAALIDDPGLRETFLSRIPDHGRVLDLARSLAKSSGA
jgi:tetratricopeptide (TPR) repeat protein